MAKESAPVVRPPWQRDRVQKKGGGEVITDKSAAAATDVNHIVKTYRRTGLMPEPRTPGQFADVSDLQGELTDKLIFAQEQMKNAQAVYDQVQKELSEANSTSDQQGGETSTPQNQTETPTGTPPDEPAAP